MKYLRMQFATSPPEGALSQDIKCHKPSGQDLNAILSFSCIH